MTTCKANSCYDSTNYSWNDYCSYHEECLSKLRQYKSISDIQEIETFETWFNGNCGWVINYDYSSSSSYPYHVWIVVYEPQHRSMSESLSVIKHNNYSSLSSARDKAIEIRDELKYSDNPILSIHSKVYDHCSFSSIVTSPYVKNNQVGTCTKTTDIPLIYVSYSSSRPSDLDRHFKPLDIVWAQCVSKWLGNEFYHVGVYLGNNTVFHFAGDNDTVEKTTWEGFLKNTTFNGITGKIIRYHPVIPFKDYKKIIGQAVWAKDRDFRKGNYNLNNRNCEHFSNMLVYGINYSQQVYERADELKVKVCAKAAGIGIMGGISIFGGIALAPFTFGTSLVLSGAGAATTVAAAAETIEEDCPFNNSKGSICLKDEIRDTDDLLCWKSDSETETYERQYLQEVPPREYCRIM